MVFRIHAVDQLRQYFTQLRQELGQRLVEKVFGNEDKPSKVYAKQWYTVKPPNRRLTRIMSAVPCGEVGPYLEGQFARNWYRVCPYFRESTVIEISQEISLPI